MRRTMMICGAEISVSDESHVCGTRVYKWIYNPFVAVIPRYTLFNCLFFYILACLPLMKSRFLVNVWLVFALLFAQQLAFAETLTNIKRAQVDYQCLYEDGACFDGGAVTHLVFDDFDNGLTTSFSLLELPNLAIERPQASFTQFFSVVSPYYFSRAPPLI
jgi:hypothetical protein